MSVSVGKPASWDKYPGIHDGAKRVGKCYGAAAENGGVAGGIPDSSEACQRDGNGMESIQLVVEQYERHMQIEEDDRSFTLTLYLKGFD